MGAEGVLIAIVIILLVGVFYGTQIMDLIKSVGANAYQNYADQTTNNALKLKPAPGQQLCSLKVVFKPFLAANVVPPIYVRIDNGASQINWYACHSTTPSALMLIPTLNPFLANAPALDLFGFFNPSPAGYHFKATLVTDDGRQTFPIVNPAPGTGINNNISGVGQTFTITYVFQDIPKQHYTLQITSSEIGINQAGSGNTYYQNIPG